MDDLDLHPAGHRKQSERLAPQPAPPAPKVPVAPAVHAVPPARTYDAPPAPQKQPLPMAYVGLGVVALGAAAYFLLGSGDAPPATNTSVTAPQTQITKREEEKKATEANQRALEEAEKREAAERNRQEIAREKARNEAIERDRVQQEAAMKLAQDQKAREEYALKVKEDSERKRKELAGKRLQSMKRGIEQDSTRHLQNIMRREAEVVEIDEQIELLNLEAIKDEQNARAVVAAKNQAEFSKKKLEEAQTQYNAFLSKFGPNNETTALYKMRVEAARRDVERYQSVAEKFSEKGDQDAMTRAKYKRKTIEEMIITLNRAFSERLADLDKIREDRDYDELVRMNEPVDSVRFAQVTREKLLKEIPNAAKYKKPGESTKAAQTPEAPKTAGPGVTVTTKKDPVTVYTMKDGKKYSATKAVDAGDQLSLKTVDGKFVSILKEDIVKEELQAD